MGRALSSDFRERGLRAWQDGISARQAAVRFGVSASSAIRWIARTGQGETESRKSGRKKVPVLIRTIGSSLPLSRTRRTSRSMRWLSVWLKT